MGILKHPDVSPPRPQIASHQTNCSNKVHRGGVVTYQCCTGSCKMSYCVRYSCNQFLAWPLAVCLPPSITTAWAQCCSNPVCSSLPPAPRPTPETTAPETTRAGQGTSLSTPHSLSQSGRLHPAIPTATPSPRLRCPHMSLGFSRNLNHHQPPTQAL